LSRKHRAAVVGIGHSKITRRAEKPLGVHAVDAARTAIADAGLTMADIDGIASTPSVPFNSEEALFDGVHYVTSHLLQRVLGANTTWADDEELMVGNSFVKAVEAIEAGACTAVLVLRALHNPAGVYGETVSELAFGRNQYMLPYGNFYPSMFAQWWTRYQDRYGSGSREQMATFVVQARKHGLMNPDGYWTNFKPEPLTVDEYLSARMVTSPLGLYDCDIPLQGAAAFVLTTAERAADLGRPAAYVHGAVNPGMRTHMHSAGALPLEEEEETAALRGKLLWNDSGLKPTDLSTADIYDGFSFLAFPWLEGLGICERGTAFEFIQDGRTTLGGELPLNLGGGNIGAGRMHGVPQLMGAVRQVMGRAGAAQVADAQFSLATVGNALFGAAVVFGREPKE
jgi:acetyl-CoA acetyltransferase